MPASLEAKQLSLVRGPLSNASKQNSSRNETFVSVSLTLGHKTHYSVEYIRRGEPTKTESIEK